MPAKHWFQLAFGVAECLSRSRFNLLQLTVQLLLGLQDGKLLADRLGDAAVRAERTNDLPAASPKPQFSICSSSTAF